MVQTVRCLPDKSGGARELLPAERALRGVHGPDQVVLAVHVVLQARRSGCCCCLPRNHCSIWTWVVEEVLAFW